MPELYLTIKTDGTHEIIIKKSQFICNIKRTTTKQEAEEFITHIKTLHRQATHNCFAYVVGPNNQIKRQSDNGEPSGTAGMPILNVLEKLNLHDTTVVVTRYFGGIKLGTGGLIRAYSKATSETIQQIGIVKKVLQRQLKLTLSYQNLGKLQNFLETKQIPIIETLYTDNVTLCLALDDDQVMPFSEQLTELFNAQIKVTRGQEQYNEVEIKTINACN